MNSVRFPVWAILCLTFAGPQPAPAQSGITAEQQAKLAELHVAVQQAGVLFVDRKFVECAAQLDDVRQALQRLLQGKDPALQRMAKPIHVRLVRAHELLESQGIQMEPLPNWAEFVRASREGEETVEQPGQSESRSGKVSFSKQVAPILLENCNGCHIGGRRASGNLRMGSFALLMRGGDSGQVISARNAGQSLLIRKLKGEEGQRMPAGGRSPLSNTDIALVSTWIEQGSVFDGLDESIDIELVVNQAWAADASHQELFERRRRQTLERWSKVLPNVVPETSVGSELFVLGNVPSSRIEQTLNRFEQAVKQVKKQLKAPLDEPLLNGGFSVFVLKSRYDYSEFGRMTESRELPKDWLGHWHADAISAYAVVMGKDLEEKQASALALQLTAGTYLGAFKDVPTWFAEGVARNLVAQAYRRGDDRVAVWQRALPAAMLQVDKASTVLENRLDEETAGVVGMGMTGNLMDRKNRRRFDNLLELLRAGRSFNEAMALVYASPEALIKSWLGK